jgi:hypothetical protein
VDSAPPGIRPAFYTAMDTAEVLSQLVVDGRLDLERSAEKMGRLLSQAGGGGRVRLVGDPAAVLFDAGWEEDAAALEELVHGLVVQHDAAVFCAYPLHGFFRRGHTIALFRTSAQHTSVAFPHGLWVRGFVGPTTSPRINAP